MQESGAEVSPAEYLMKRLRAEYGLEFICVDLSERSRLKVIEYAGLLRDWEAATPGGDKNSG